MVAVVEREERLRRAAEYEEPEWVKASEAVASDSEVSELLPAFCLCKCISGSNSAGGVV
jgi:hypothetical protein